MTEVLIGSLTPGSVDADAVAHYGDPMREQRELATGAGLVDRSHREVMRIGGTDRLGWLHSLSTQHLVGLAPGQGTELLVLSPHGHIEHHAVLADLADTAWLDTEPGRAAPLLEFLGRMVFLMRVEPSDVTADWALLSLVGPAADEAVTRLGVAALPPPDVTAVPGPKFATGQIPARPTTVYEVAALPGGGWARRMAYGYDLLVPRSGRDHLAGVLEVPRAGLWAFEALRTEARRPRLGADTDHRTIPAEVGWLAPAVHLDKGCYRGQETVARVHNLGRPPRRLVLLHLDGLGPDELPAAGTAVTMSDGRQVGFLGSAARHHELGMVALAVVKRNVPDNADLRVGEHAAAIDPGDG
jgi:folate-binding protein YgfZ